MSSKIEENSDVQHWLNDIGNAGQHTLSLDNVIDATEQRLLSKGIKIEESAGCSTAYWKNLSIQKDLSSRAFNWVNPKGCSMTELSRLNDLRKTLHSKKSSSEDKEKVLKELRKITLEGSIRRMTIEKSLVQQHSIPEETKTTIITDSSLDVCPIDYNDQNTSPLMDKPRIELTPEVESQLINNLKKPIDDYSEAQQINVSSKVNKWGKFATNEDGNTYLGRNISRLPLKTFGSVGEYHVDSLPLSVVKCKGTTITCMDTKGMEFQGVQTISRRFISKVIQLWSYVVDLRGNSGIANYRRALDMCAITLTPTALFGLDDNRLLEASLNAINPETLDGKNLNKLSSGNLVIDMIRKREYKIVNGDLAISMIKDLLFLIRNQKINPDKISLNLYNITRAKTYEDKKDFDTILNEMKSRLQHLKQLGEDAWGYSSIHPEYLVCLLNELRSGDYDRETLVPAILNLYKYPIECKDTHVKQMSEKQHSKNIDDYDIGNYIFERN